MLCTVVDEIEQSALLPRSVANRNDPVVVLKVITAGTWHARMEGMHEYWKIERHGSVTSFNACEDSRLRHRHSDVTCSSGIERNPVGITLRANRLSWRPAPLFGIPSLRCW